MSIRARRATTDRLELSEGDYLIVKQDLTAGEYRDLMRASVRPVMVTAANDDTNKVPAPMIELDPVAAGLALVLAYLLDWSFTDADGRPIVIADQPATVVRAALDNIDPQAYMEVQRAIQTHQATRAAILAEEKKTRSGALAPDKTLTSVE